MKQLNLGFKSGWNSTSRPNFIAIVLFLAVACAPLSGWANSNIDTAFRLKYQGVDVSCNSCHEGGFGTVGTPNVLSRDSLYAQKLYSQLGSPSDVGGLSIQTVSSAMSEIESFFAGEITNLQARDSGGGLLKTVSFPDRNVALPAETAEVRVVFGLPTRPFFTANGSDGKETQDHKIDNPGFSNVSKLAISGGSNVFDIALPNPEERRAARQAEDFPYKLDFDPVTTFGFKNTNDADITNSFNIETANFPPVALADTFKPTLLEVQDSSGQPVEYPLNVLVRARDYDPDHEEAALTVSPATPAVSPSYGTVSVNATNTGYNYTAPATLDTVSRPVTFSYSAVDEERGVSIPVTVTISVPAAAPPSPPTSFVANNDLFRIAEGGSLLNADVKTDNGSGPDDLDGAPLGEVAFTSDDPSVGTLAFRADGTFDLTPPEDFSGDITLTYRLSDGTSFDDAVVTIRVTPINDPPVVAPITLISVNESRGAFTANLLDPSKISDPDGDTLTVQNASFAITQRPAGAARTIDGSAAVSVSGNSLTIDPTAFSNLDNDEFADVTVSYQVSDGTKSVSNTLGVTIIGLDNGLGRQPGAYADTLSERYVSADFGPHFEGQASAPSACLTCHASLATVDADVDSVDECRQTPPVFNAYGLELCLNRSAGTPPLTDLLRRMREAEPNYAPVLAATNTLQVQQSAAAGTKVGDPLTTSTTGRDVFGAAARIHSYLISTGDQSPPSTTDPTGQFSIDASGQITVASNDLAAGSYTLNVLPVNDAGQRNDKGARISAPGFFLQEPGPESAVTIEVLGGLLTPVDDTVNSLVNTEVEVNVLANDTGGDDAVSLKIVSQPSNGSVKISSNLSIKYTPDTDFVGTDSFTYISSNTTGAANNSAIVTVNVVAAEGVSAVNDSVTAIEGRTTLIDVLANDNNARRDGVNATTVTILDRPDPTTEGSVSVSGQSVSFSPVAGFTGTTGFSYRAVNPTPTGNVGSNATVMLNVVEVGKGAIAAAIIDPELLKVAQSFEQSCVIVRNADPADIQSQQFLDVCAALTVAAINSEDLTQAMRALRNEEHFAAVDATAAVARGLGRLVSRRLTQIRDGAARGFNTSAITLRIADQIIPTELVAQAARGILGLGDDIGGSPTWGLFIAGDIAWAERDPNANSGSYELQADNLMIGYDRVLDDRSSLGFALGYSDTSTDFERGGSLKSQGYQFTLYGVQKDLIRRNMTFEGFLSVGRMDFSSDRRINFTNGGTTVDTSARAQFDGTYINVAPKLSYSRVLGDYNDPIGAPRTATRVTWSASLDYIWMNLDDYTETGGNGLGLNVQSETYESLILAVGLDASRPVYFGSDTRAEMYGGFEIFGELLDRNRTVSSAFAVAGPNAPRFLVSEEGTYGLGAGFEIGTVFSLGRNGQIDLNYGYDFAGGGLSTQHLALSYTLEMKRNDSLSLNMSRSFSANGGDRTAAELDYRLRF